MKKTLYKKIEELARISGKTVPQVAKELGYPRNTLHNYKYNKNPSAVRLFQIARYFEVKPEYLLGETDEISIRDVKGIFNRLSSEQKQEIYILAQYWMTNQLRDNELVEKFK